MIASGPLRGSPQAGIGKAVSASTADRWRLATLASIWSGIRGSPGIASPRQPTPDLGVHLTPAAAKAPVL